MTRWCGGVLFQEFERILQEVDSVELLAPKPTNSYRHGIRVAARLENLSPCLSIPVCPP